MRTIQLFLIRLYDWLFGPGRHHFVAALESENERLGVRLTWSFPEEYVDKARLRLTEIGPDAAYLNHIDIEDRSGYLFLEVDADILEGIEVEVDVVRENGRRVDKHGVQLVEIPEFPDLALESGVHR